MTDYVEFEIETETETETELQTKFKIANYIDTVNQPITISDVVSNLNIDKLDALKAVRRLLMEKFIIHLNPNEKPTDTDKASIIDNAKLEMSKDLKDHSLEYGCNPHTPYVIRIAESDFYDLYWHDPTSLMPVLTRIIENDILPIEITIISNCLATNRNSRPLCDRALVSLSDLFAYSSAEFYKLVCNLLANSLLIGTNKQCQVFLPPKLATEMIKYLNHDE